MAGKATLIENDAGSESINSFYRRVRDDPDVSLSYIRDTLSSIVRAEPNDDVSHLPLPQAAISLQAKETALEKLVDLSSFFTSKSQSQAVLNGIIADAAILFSNGFGKKQACSANCNVLLFAAEERMPKDFVIPFGMKVILQCQATGSAETKETLEQIRKAKRLPPVLRDSAECVLETEKLPTEEYIREKRTFRIFGQNVCTIGSKTLNMAFPHKRKQVFIPQ